MKNITNYLAAITLAGSLYSCNPVPDTSITEPLPEKEWTEIAKQDTLFGKVYPVIREIVFKLNTPELRSKYKDLTYRDMLTFFKYTTDYTCKRNSDSQKDYAQWESVYGTYAEKADSVINYWEKQFNENSEIEKDLRYYYNYYESAGRTPDPITWSVNFKYLTGMSKHVMDYLAYKYGIYHSYKFFQTDFKAKIAESFSSVGYESDAQYMSNKLYERNNEKFPKQMELMTEGIIGK